MALRPVSWELREVGAPGCAWLDQNEEEKAWDLPSAVTELWRSWADSMDPQRRDVKYFQKVELSVMLGAGSPSVRVSSWKGLWADTEQGLLEGSTSPTIPEGEDEAQSTSTGRMIVPRASRRSFKTLPTLLHPAPALEGRIHQQIPCCLALSKWGAPAREEKKGGVYDWYIFFWLPPPRSSWAECKLIAHVRRSSPSRGHLPLLFLAPSSLAIAMVSPCYQPQDSEPFGLPVHCPYLY